MSYQWNEDKARTYREKHGVDFADAVGVFEDERALTVADDYVEEERFVTVGTDPLGRILAVAYTWRGENIRLISARSATSRERRQYQRKR